MPTISSRPVVLIAGLLSLLAADPMPAEDWPEWRGAGRGGEWTEAPSELVESFPETGLDPAWRTPIHGGYAGPAVSGGLVFVVDFERKGRTAGAESTLALDERSGELKWKRSWPADYVGLEPRYATGPRATPTVDGERVFALGAMGQLVALTAADGAVEWRRDFVAEYGTEVPVWGMSGSPVVHGRLLVALVGGKKGATAVAFDKASGEEVWRAIETDGEPGYASPILFDVDGRTQLVLWHPGAIYGLDPATGKELWRVPFEVTLGLTVASPVLSGDKLLVSSFFNGSALVQLGGGSTVKELWRGASSSEVDTDGLHALITTPVIDGDTIYGVGSYGQLRALDLATGERLWETMAPVVEKARWAAAFLVKNGDRYVISNDRGELILATLDRRDGYREIDRADLIEPTSPIGRREKKAVHWSHPAYANGHVVIRNDREVLRVDLRRPRAEPPAAESASPAP
ncbi:MAG: PQQ-binding-like beta-propeller repeat protein [Acidobacteriota bacterium]